MRWFVSIVCVAIWGGVTFGETGEKSCCGYTAVRNLYGVSERDHRPLRIQESDSVGVHFHSDYPVDRLSACCPSYSNNKGSLTFTIYRWQGSVTASRQGKALAKQRFVDFKDCAVLSISFPRQAGDFYGELSEGEESVGIWRRDSSVKGVQYFVNGSPTNGSFEFSINLHGFPVPDTGSGAVLEKLAGPTIAPPQCASSVSDDHGALIPGKVFEPRDLYADTWDAIDGLGRTLERADTLPAPRAKQVGIFYWTWHERFVAAHEPRNNARLVTENPGILERPNDPLWGPAMRRHHWDEPLFGYYQTIDTWVLRKHAQLLSAAGIDTVAFDATNASLTWMDSAWALLRTWSAMRRDGLRTPCFIYMLPFHENPHQIVSILQLYRDLYKPGKFRDLWFYWNGRPLIHATPRVIERAIHSSKTSEADRRDLEEILRFFTFRPLQASYTVGPTSPDQWCWLEVFPQHAYCQREDGTFEMCGAGVAQNHTWKGRDGHKGLAAMNDIHVFGRAYVGPSENELQSGEKLRFAADRNPRRGEPLRFLWGDNFAQQMRRAREIDPDYLFITGWNEWSADLFPNWMGTKTAFPDQFSPEFSRDLEPSAGILQDHFYYQFVNEVRRFRGVRPQRACREAPIYRDAVHDTLPRDAVGYGGIRYKDSSGRNDLAECYVEHEAKTITFRVVCSDPVTSYADPNWMRLFLSVSLDANDPLPNWNHFHFVVNRVSPPDDHTAILEICEGGWRWKELARVPMTVTGKEVTLLLPRQALRLEERKLNLWFKWADNTPCGEGNILDFYRFGDAAPDGRFLYRYFEK